MKTYCPTWTLHAKLLVATAGVAYMLFAVGAFYITRATAIQAIQSQTKESFLVLLLPLALISGLVFWTYGLLDLLTKTFTLSVENKLLRFFNEGGLLKKQKEIRLDDIQCLSLGGNPTCGLWLLVQTRNRTHRLGHLLSLSDAEEIISKIQQAKDSTIDSSRR